LTRAARREKDRRMPGDTVSAAQEQRSGGPGRSTTPGSRAVRVDDVQARCRAELARAAGGGQVVWTDGDAELLVRADAARVRCVDGAVLVGLPVYTDQTGEAEVVLAFAVGAGLRMAAERPPRGPDTVVDRWGEALLAAGWDALVAVAAGVAAAGNGSGGTPGPARPVALAATADGLTVDVARGR
jgi:hypothetical protein